MDTDTCALIGQVFDFLQKNPDGKDRLKKFIAGSSKELYTVEEASQAVGISARYLKELIKLDKVSFIPGKPHMILMETFLKELQKVVTTASKYRKRKKKGGKS